MVEDLNPAQRSAVETLSGPMLVLAGAGSGKTRVVTFRIANLIRNGIPADRILAVTFTKKAAAEMQERAASLLGKRSKKKPVISTYHSLCLQILRRHIRRLGYPEKFAIYDRGDQESVARRVLREIKVPAATMKPSDLLAAIGHWKTLGISPSSAAAMADTDKEHLAAMGYRRYQKAIRANGAVDFDDLLNLAEQLLSKFPAIRKEEAQRYDHLLVDEYQDTNDTQYRIVRALAAGHRNLCVVGDDDQSIYSWRGARLNHILNFKKDWANAKIVQLVDNYRSTAAILEMANRLIAHNKNRHPKILRAARPGGQKPRIWQLPDESQEAEQVVKDIQQRLIDPMIEPRDFAVLFRTNEQPRTFEQEFRRANLPYVLIGGMSFFDRKEVRDILSYLRLIATPSDEVALLRIINTPARGIGQSTVQRLMTRAVESGTNLHEVLMDTGSDNPENSAATDSINKFCALIEQLRATQESMALAPFVQLVIDRVEYRKEVDRLYKSPDDREARWATIEEVVNSVSDYSARAKKKASLTGFLDDIAFSQRDEANDKEAKLNRNAITLLTLHSAKGLEFPEVYLVGMEEGLLPHRRSVEADGEAINEERRLCYVGVTRAENRLTLTLALSRKKWGKSRDTVPSRFLFELIGQAENPHTAAKKRTSGKKRASTR